MKNTPEVLFKIEEFSLNLYLLRIICVVWIAFSTYQYDINPFFFGLTILVAVTLIFSAAETSIILYHNSLEIKDKRFISFLTTSDIHQITEIENIEFESDEFSSIRALMNVISIFSSSIGSSSTPLKIKPRNKPWCHYRLIGSAAKNEELVRIMQESITSSSK